MICTSLFWAVLILWAWGGGDKRRGRPWWLHKAIGWDDKSSSSYFHTYSDSCDISTARKWESVGMNIWIPSAICRLAVQHQDIPPTIPIKASINVKQDILPVIKKVQSNSALVGRLINSFHHTRRHWFLSEVELCIAAGLVSAVG